MKKIVVLGMVALLLASGLVLASCGPKCPGDGTSGGEGGCEFSIKINGLIPTTVTKFCSSKDCGVYKYVNDGKGAADAQAGKEVSKKCDC
jgi:hypothetical protein